MAYNSVRNGKIIKHYRDLQLYDASHVKVASFRDWSFVKFLEPKS